LLSVAVVAECKVVAAATAGQAAVAFKAAQLAEPGYTVKDIMAALETIINLQTL
jgi:hypothetical protein